MEICSMDWKGRSSEMNMKGSKAVQSLSDTELLLDGGRSEFLFYSAFNWLDEDHSHYKRQIVFKFIDSNIYIIKNNIIDTFRIILD